MVFILSYRARKQRPEQVEQTYKQCTIQTDRVTPVSATYFGASDGNKKESRWQNQGKKKVLVTKMIRPNSPGKSEKHENQKRAARTAQAGRASLIH
jgi:hypothetical protein